jgi:phosphate:Na+ symporter
MAMQTIVVPAPNGSAAGGTNASERQHFLLSTRERCLKLGADLAWEERGAIRELLGSAERAFFLIDRIDAERRSVPRVVMRLDTSAPNSPALGSPVVPGDRPTA